MRAMSILFSCSRCCHSRCLFLMPFMFIYSMLRCCLRFVYFFMLAGGGEAFVMEVLWGVYLSGEDVVGCGSGMDGMEGHDPG